MEGEVADLSVDQQTVDRRFRVNSGRMGHQDKATARDPPEKVTGLQIFGEKQIKFHNFLAAKVAALFNRVFIKCEHKRTSRIHNLVLLPFAKCEELTADYWQQD